MAVNCWVRPLASVGLAGVTAIDSRTAALAVSTVEPVTPANVALILEVPLDATAVASPPVVMVATEVVADAQVTELVRFWVEPSE